MISLAPKSLFLGSKKIGSSLYLIVKPATSWASSKAINFSWLNAATTNSLLKFKISTLDISL